MSLDRAGLENCEAPDARCGSTYWSNGVIGIDTRFVDFSRSVSPRKHFLASRSPGLHHIVERRTGIRQAVEVFILAGESGPAGIAALVPIGSGSELSPKTTEPHLSWQRSQDRPIPATGPGIDG